MLSAAKPKTARRALDENHAVWQAILKAGAKAETEEERFAVDEALRSGQLLSGGNVSAEIARRSRGWRARSEVDADRDLRTASDALAGGHERRHGDTALC
ncbi:hypothetical protein [Sorangium sp. So ce1024]|uniref:hypothetical protein n=1 Tax=Sorangium sp. So ce1024 TaxID=3133327 RepID=UPI003F112AC4